MRRYGCTLVGVAGLMQVSPPGHRRRRPVQRAGRVRGAGRGVALLSRAAADAGGHPRRRRQPRSPTPGCCPTGRSSTCFSATPASATTTRSWPARALLPIQLITFQQIGGVSPVPLNIPEVLPSLSSGPPARAALAARWRARRADENNSVYRLEQGSRRMRRMMGTSWRHHGARFELRLVEYPHGGRARRCSAQRHAACALSS